MTEETQSPALIAKKFSLLVLEAFVDLKVKLKFDFARVESLKSSNLPEEAEINF